MGHHDERDAFLLVQLHEELAEIVRGDTVQGAGGFVGEQELGAIDQGADDCHPLAFAAGQLARAMRDPVLQSNAVQQTTRALLGSCIQLRIRADQRRHEHVLNDRALRQQVM